MKRQAVLVLRMQAGKSVHVIWVGFSRLSGLKKQLRKATLVTIKRCGQATEILTSALGLILDI